MSTYAYVEKPADLQSKYETNILVPLESFFETVFTDTKKTDNKYASDLLVDEWQYLNVLLSEWKLTKDNMTNIKNMLVMLWWKDKTYKTTIIDKMNGLITDDNTYTQKFTAGTTEITIKNPAWTKLGTLKFGYTEGADEKRTLTPSWIAANA